MSAVPVHHVVTGAPQAPVVVLANSLGSTMAMWGANLPALQEHFRVVRYDTRGHGASLVPPGPSMIDDLVDDVIALLDTLGVQRAHLVGLSLGGMTALRLAARHPERVDRMVVLCTGARLDPPSTWTERAAKVRAEGTAAVASDVVRRWFTPAYLDAHPEERQRYEAMVAATPAEGYAQCCEAIADIDLRADLPRIAAPTLAVAGLADQATPPAQLAAIARGVPHGRLVVVPDAAHLANAEQPDLVTAAILEHLAGTAERQKQHSEQGSLA